MRYICICIYSCIYTYTHVDTDNSMYIYICHIGPVGTRIKPFRVVTALGSESLTVFGFCFGFRG